MAGSKSIVKVSEQWDGKRFQFFKKFIGGKTFIQAVLDAAHIAYASVYASEFEERGGRFGAGSRIEECVDRLPDNLHLPIA